MPLGHSKRGGSECQDCPLHLPAASGVPRDVRASGDSGPAPRSFRPGQAPGLGTPGLCLLTAAGAPRSRARLVQHPRAPHEWVAQPGRREGLALVLPHGCCSVPLAPPPPHPPAVTLAATPGCPRPCISLLSKTNFCSCQSPFPGRFHQANSLHIPKSRHASPRRAAAKRQRGAPGGVHSPLARRDTAARSPRAPAATATAFALPKQEKVHHEPQTTSPELRRASGEEPGAAAGGGGGGRSAPLAAPLLPATRPGLCTPRAAP